MTYDDMRDIAVKCKTDDDFRNFCTILKMYIRQEFSCDADRANRIYAYVYSNGHSAGAYEMLCITEELYDTFIEK